ncbi:CLUMA_CG018252, isoform A [Clunio marinus]|uniref:CLUMA_CG018252, isoform A n=1 Tax=Clunio marinus TaxID=568069 RepID=A0A1J1J0N1_9DIPT|nr:CLUMA_CG018252, isoform A [Clunio marinus]
MMKLICLVVCLITIINNLKTTSAQGNNLYLPPEESKPGYDYKKPSSSPPSRPSSPSKPPSNEAHEPGMPFDFNYAVSDSETANNHNHNANSDGDVTQGEYRVQLPDGRTQVVRYTADWKNGYNAEVSYE